MDAARIEQIRKNKAKITIRQLEDLRAHCLEMAKNADDEAPWKKDVEAIEEGIKAIKMFEEKVKEIEKSQ